MNQQHIDLSGENTTLSKRTCYPVCNIKN